MPTGNNNKHLPLLLDDGRTNTSIMRNTPDQSTVTEQQTKKSGIWGASSNLLNSIVGAGIIGLPYALRQSGLIAGVILLLLVSVLTDYSLRLITKLAQQHPKLKPNNVMTFEHLSSFPFGSVGNYFILTNMFLLAYGAMVAYLLIIKDTVPPLIGLYNGIEREIVLVVTSLVVIVPLSCMRDMATLSFTSFLSVTCDALLVVFIIIYSPIQSTVEENGGFGEVLLDKSIRPTVFVGLGIISTAMACQHSCFIVHNSLENNSEERWAKVTFQSLFMAFVMCAVLAVSGYLGYLDNTLGDVLNNFEPDSVVANGARGLLAITMFFTYPMEAFVGRHVIYQLFFHLDSNSADVEDAHSGMRYKVTISLYLATLLPALVFDDLGPVLSITGSLGGSCIAYIAPGMVFLGVYGEEFIAYMNGKSSSISRNRNGGGDVELPVAGNNERVIATSAPTTIELPVAGESTRVLQVPSYRRPWWWYPLLIPLWMSIAEYGSAGMRLKHTSVTFPVVAPRGRDYVIAILYILFGVIAAVAGLVSIFFVEADEQPL